MGNGESACFDEPNRVGSSDPAGRNESKGGERTLHGQDPVRPEVRGGEHLQDTVVEPDCLLDLASGSHSWEEREPDRLGGGRDLGVKPRGHAEFSPCSESAF